MEPNKLEQDIKQKLEGRIINPSPMAWDRLDAMLTVAEQQEQKIIPVKRNRRGGIYIAASVAVLVGLGMFFLNREDAGIINTGNAPQVVTSEAEKTTTPAETNDTPAVENVTTTPAKPVYVVVKGKAKQHIAGNGGVTPPQVDVNPVKQEIAQNAPQAQTQQKEQTAPASNKLKVDANALLASVEGKASQDNTAVAASINQPKLKVNSNALLNSVEGELNESFRSKVINSVQKNYNAVKSAVATRNLQ